MLKKTFVALYLATLSGLAMAQSWVTLDPFEIQEKSFSHYAFMPIKYQALKVVWSDLVQSKEEGLIVLPLPDGSLHTFTLREISNLPPALAASYLPAQRLFGRSNDRRSLHRCEGRIHRSPDRLPQPE